jgi:hypothetical protein
VRVFDPVELEADPIGALELALTDPDECGWFHTTIDAVAGWTVVHTGDIPGTGSDHRRVTTVVPTLVPGQTFEMNAFVLRTTTDEAWSADASLPLTTFATAGSLMAFFIDITEPPVWPFQGAPVSGVTLLVDGSTRPSEDYYFSDADAVTRSDVDPGLTTTGVNGAALMRTTAVLGDFSGQGAGCGFNPSQGLPIPTTVQVQEIAGVCN